MQQGEVEQEEQGDVSHDPFDTVNFGFMKCSRLLLEARNVQVVDDLLAQTANGLESLFYGGAG